MSVTTAKLTRIGSVTVDTVPIEKLFSAIKNSNRIDKMIVVNDVQYDFSTVEFVVDAPPPV